MRVTKLAPNASWVLGRVTGLMFLRHDVTIVSRVTRHVSRVRCDVCHLVPQKSSTLSTVAATVKLAPHSTTPTTRSPSPPARTCRVGGRYVDM